MADDFVQVIKDAREDATSLSQFMYYPANSMVERRLSPQIHSLNYYLDYLHGLELVYSQESGTVIVNGEEVKTVRQSINDSVDSAILGEYQTQVELKVAELSGDVSAQKLDTGITATPKVVGMVARTQASKNSDVVSVKDFGAKGDGVKDDSLAVQKAIDYLLTLGGGTLFVPKGIYCVQNIKFYPKIYINGEGMGVTNFILPTTFHATHAMFKADANSQSPFYFGGFSNLSITGNGTGKQANNFPPGNGNGTLINGIDFSALDSEGSGYRLFGWQAHNIQLEQLNDGLYLSNNLYTVLLSNVIMRWCARGMYFYEQHPCMVNCETRMCDIGLECRAVIDWSVTQCTWSTCRIGIKGNISRSQIVNCRFWQNQEYAIELGSQSVLMSCLIKGASGNLPAPIEGMVLVKLRGRHNRIIANTFYGDNLGACIEFAQTNTAPQHGNIIANNNAYINKGGFIEKTGNGSCAHVQILGNYILIQASADLETTKGLFVDIPTGTQGWVGAKYANNIIRVEGNSTNNLTVPLLNCYDKISSATVINNDVQLTGTITVQGFARFSSIQGSTIIGNSLKSSTNNGNYIKPIDIPSFPSNEGLICHSNIGFTTEDSGTVQILPTDASKIVTHNLDVKPRLQDISVNMSGWGNASKIWITDITDNSFKINLDVATGALYTVGWSIQSPYLN